MALLLVVLKVAGSLRHIIIQLFNGNYTGAHYLLRSILEPATP